MPFCPECGTEHTKEANFCPNCGETLQENQGGKISSSTGPAFKLSSSYSTRSMLIAAALVLLLIVGGWLIASGKIFQNDENKIESVITRFGDAFRDHDAQAAKKIIADNYSDNYYSSKEELLEEFAVFEAMSEELQIVHFDVNVESLTIDEETATAKVGYEMTIEDLGQQESDTGTWKIKLTKVDSNWYIRSVFENYGN